MAGVPQHDVAGRVEDPVDGEGQLDGPEVGTQVPAGAGDGVDDELSDLDGEGAELGVREPPDVVRPGDGLEEHLRRDGTAPRRGPQPSHGRRLRLRPCRRPDDPKATGKEVVASAKVALAQRLATLLRKDPDLAATAMEVGLVDRQWMDEPGQHPVSTAGALDVVERFLERSAERRPSLVARLGLSTLQVADVAVRGARGGVDGARCTMVFTDLEGFTRFTARSGDEALAPAGRPPPGRRADRAEPGREDGEAAGRRADAVVHRAGQPPRSPPWSWSTRRPAGCGCGPASTAATSVVLTDDVIGHTVNVAARVAEASKGGQVLATADVIGAAGELRGVRGAAGPAPVVQGGRRLGRRPPGRAGVTARSAEGVPRGPARFQRAGFGVASLSASPLYEALADAALADAERGGPCAAVLAARCRPTSTRSSTPSPCATSAPCTASCCGAGRRTWPGGSTGRRQRRRRPPTGTPPAPTSSPPTPPHRDELIAGLALGVQTNEVGRCATAGGRLHRAAAAVRPAPAAAGAGGVGRA